MAPTDDERILCPSRLSKMASDLNSTATARAYAGDFLSMLPARIRRIITALYEGDDPAAMDAVLSLKVNSHMVGAPTMEQDCRDLERHLRAGDPPAPTVAASDLTAHGAALAQALTEYLSEKPGTGTCTGHALRQRNTPPGRTAAVMTLCAHLPEPQALILTAHN